MGFWSNLPITSQRQYLSILWGKKLYEDYIAKPSTLLPKHIVDNVVKQMKQDLARWEVELKEYENRKQS